MQAGNVDTLLTPDSHGRRIPRPYGYNPQCHASNTLYRHRIKDWQWSRMKRRSDEGDPRNWGWFGVRRAGR